MNFIKFSRVPFLQNISGCSARNWYLCLWFADLKHFNPLTPGVPEAVAQLCSLKKVFCKIHRKTHVPGSFFNRAAGLWSDTLWNLAANALGKFLRTASFKPLVVFQHARCSNTSSPTCCNSPRKCTPVKYKARQKARFPIVTYTTSKAAAESTDILTDSHNRDSYTKRYTKRNTIIFQNDFSLNIL